MFYLFARLITALPFSMAISLGRRVGKLAYLIDIAHRRIAINNIRNRLGVDEVEANRIASCVFENIGMGLVEFLNTPKMDVDFFDRHSEVEGFENYESAKGAGKGVLFLSAHIGGWEICPAFHLIKMGEKAGVIYRKTKNPYVNDHIDKIRSSYGLKTIPSRNSVKEIISILKEGNGVAILLDQNPRLREAVVVDFMGTPTPTNLGLALIAIKTGAPVVPMFTIRMKDGRYNVIYEKAICPERSGDIEMDIKEATLKFNNVIEKYVRHYPEQWFWVHDRWRVQRKRGKMAFMEDKNEG